MAANGHARQRARRFLTTRMALALGFGVLLTLLVLSGINAVRVISQLQASNESILGEFLGRQTKLDELRSSIYLSGTYVRDYLLEPDLARAEQSRRALVDTRRQIQSMISLTASEPAAAGEAMYEALRREIEEYWRTLDPVLTWNALQRHREGYRFLHDEVLPRRSSTLGIADTIASVNQQQLVERDHRLFQMFSGLRNRLMIAVIPGSGVNFADPPQKWLKIGDLFPSCLQHSIDFDRRGLTPPAVLACERDAVFSLSTLGSWASWLIAE